jgi:tetratricopeptide (TPR) repeat protein
LDVADAKALIDALDAEFSHERDFIDGLPESSRTSHGTPEAWSAKDLQAHITAWKHQTVLRLQEDPTAIVEESEEDTDRANAEFFETYANRPWDDVVDDANTTHQDLTERLSRLSKDQLMSSDLFPWQDGLPLWRRLAGTLLVHPWMHLAEHAVEAGDLDRAKSIADRMLATLKPVSDDPNWVAAADYNAACLHARCGDLDKAFEELETALNVRTDLIEWSKLDTDLDALRSDDRLAALYTALNEAHPGEHGAGA